MSNATPDRLRQLADFAEQSGNKPWLGEIATILRDLASAQPQEAVACSNCGGVSIGSAAHNWKSPGVCEGPGASPPSQQEAVAKAWCATHGGLRDADKPCMYCSSPPSLLDEVPKGWRLQRIEAIDAQFAKYRAVLYGPDRAMDGTGPTPESALQDAASRVKK